MKKHILIVKDHGLIPKAAKEYFPSSVDGYSFLIVHDEGPVEFWKYFYGDIHPWKEYRDHEHLVDRIGRREAANILRSVRNWNSEFKRRETIKAEQSTKRQADQKAWLDQFPADFMGFIKEGQYLVDQYQNEIVDLLALFPMSVAEVEQRIIELFEDGCFGD